ncbi:leucine-rich repeat extensin-like protein 5 [Drosophila erecta]|uniref:leucine-rich repeat extensin-like protein 5 n=1 Tax=Drosophila erecta TaxID=7220 RepID=UPI000F05D1CE|nr:leucine-rich repeat extensin-like protein 5 [Drosophila erecta]
MRILWIVAISVSWQFSDAYFFMPKFLCIPPFVAINGSCLIPTTTKPLIPPCSKNPQNSTVLPENPEIVTVTPPDLLPEDGDSIGENIAKDKEPSLPIKVPAVPSENEVSTESSVNTSSPAPDDTIISNPEIIPPSKHVNSSEILTNPGQETDGSQHPGKGTTLKPIVPDANKVSTESSANTTNLDPNDNIIKKPEVSDQNPISENPTRNKTDSESNKIIGEDLLPEHVGNQTKPSSNSSTNITGTTPGNPPTNPIISGTDNLGNVILPPISGGSVGGLPITPSIPDTDEIASGISPGIPLPGNLSLPKDPSMPEIPDTEKLINDILPSGRPPKVSLNNPEEISKIPAINPITPDTGKVIPLPGNSSHPTMTPITEVGSETHPIVPTHPTDNLVGPPKIPPHEVPGLKPPIPPKIPETNHLVNGSLPSGDLIDKYNPPKIPEIPDTDELINRLLPTQRPTQIPLPGIPELKPPIPPPPPSKIELPKMPKIIEPQIPIPKLIRPEDLYPKYTNIQPLLPKDIKPYNFTGV